METTLFERLGRTSGIDSLVHAIIEAHMINPVIAARFVPYKDDPKRLAELTQHLSKFMEAGSGGTQAYAGRSMPDAHRGLNISNAEYMAAMDDIMGVLRSRDIDADSQKDVLAILYTLKPEIVNL
jgi:hemoglobin